jgi:hypothetical protein
MAPVWLALREAKTDGSENGILIVPPYESEAVETYRDIINSHKNIRGKADPNGQLVARELWTGLVRRGGCVYWHLQILMTF